MLRLVGPLVGLFLCLATVPALARSGANSVSFPYKGDVHAIVTERAHAYGVPVRLAHAVTVVESGYRCSAVGSAGELGPMQVKPATARGVGVYGNLRDCRTGVEAGMRYLRQAIGRYGAGCAGISAYNRGLYARPVCSAYGRKVLRAV